MIRYISHRGNLDSVIPEKENKPSYIDEALALGYDVELDVRAFGTSLYLGHDHGDYIIDLEWLLERKDHIWVHTKNFQALRHLIDEDLKVFYHQKENHSIINNCNIIWTHELSEACEKSIIPLLSLMDIENYDGTMVLYGICSDFITSIRKK